MHPILRKTFGGLTLQYYLRHFVFGLIFPAIFLYASTHAKTEMTLSNAVFMTVLFTINTLLYPYSRFVYESVMGFIMGRNVFIVNAIAMLVVKVVTMALCWSFAIIIAPFGLAYLYFATGRTSAAS